MPMTRTQIKAAALQILGEDSGTPGLDSIYMMDTWVNTAADEIARATDCYYGAVTLEVVAGQPLYSAPQIYKLKAASWVDSSGNRVILQQSSPAGLDGRFSGWRNQPSGSPAYYAAEGANLIRLYPAPDTSSLLFAYTDLVINSDGSVSSASRPFLMSDVSRTLRVTGGTGFVPTSYTVMSVAGGTALLNTPPGTALSTGGQAILSYGGLTAEGYLTPADSWPLPAQNCPLPDRAHMAVVWRLAKFRAIQFPTPENIARVGLIDNEYKRALGLLEAEAHRMTADTSHADMHRNPFGYF